jgi:hypothetical protein
LLVWLTCPQPGVTERNFYRLRKGMTLRDVEAILGEPGVPHSAMVVGGPEGPYELMWWGTSNLNAEMPFIEVLFSARHHDWRLADAQLTPADGEFLPREEPTFITRLSRLLPWSGPRGSGFSE